MAVITEIKVLEGNRFPLKPGRALVGEVAADQPRKLDIPLPPPTKLPTEIMSIDHTTPDNHVPRDPRLIRLTGAHPLNCEAPLTSLFKEGMC